MGIQMTKVSAISELERAICAISRKLQRQGMKYRVTSDAQDSYEQVLQDVENGCITVSNVGNDSSLYHPSVNLQFRFWHDYVHGTLKRDFSLEGELVVILHQIQQLRGMGVSEEALELFRADTIGQVKYYYKHKQFIKDQSKFVEYCLEYGIDKAVEDYNNA